MTDSWGDALARAHNLPPEGGRIELPDGTVIEVRRTVDRPEMKVWSKETRPWIEYADHLESEVTKLTEAYATQVRVADRNKAMSDDFRAKYERALADYTELADGVEKREDEMQALKDDLARFKREQRKT